MPLDQNLPLFRAVLFGLSGCLVDFGARTLPQALLAATAHPPLEPLVTPPVLALQSCLGRTPLAEDRKRLEDNLLRLAYLHAEPTPGALEALGELRQQGIPWAYLDELPTPVMEVLARQLPPADGPPPSASRPWPAPDACLNALIGLDVDRLEGCLLVSGDPRLLQAGLHAGLWTIGLAASGPLCGLTPAEWLAMDRLERDRRRAQATMQLYRCGAHSVIDHLAELGPCLVDLASRRAKGEKP